MLQRRGRAFATGLLCLAVISGCQPGHDAAPGAGTTGQPPFTLPAQPGSGSPSAVPSTAPSADPAATVRGTVVFALATKDGYKGTITLIAYEPVAFKAYPGSSALAECIPYPDPAATALVRVDFKFADESPPDFPWELGWSVDAFGGSGHVLATRSNPPRPFACRQAQTWSGTGTMSVLVAMDDFYSPKTPKGKPERLKDTGAAFLLISDVTSDEVRISATTGNARGGIATYVTPTPTLQIAFGPKS